jgi:hypothetical protein
MMTVVAVIMILAALLLSAIGKTRARAIRTQCLNNIKQVDLLLLMYGHENNDRLPQITTFTTLPPPLVEMVLRGRISHQVFYDPGIDDQSSNWFNVSTVDPGRQIGYCLTLPGPLTANPTNVNATIMPQPISAGPNMLLPPPNASQRVLVAGVISAKDTGLPVGVGGAHLDSKSLILGDNVAMLDGSARWKKFKDMIPRTGAKNTGQAVGDYYWFWW